MTLITGSFGWDIAISLTKHAKLGYFGKRIVKCPYQKFFNV